MSKPQDVQPKPDDAHPRRLYGPALWVALAVLIAFTVFTVVMIASTNTAEIRWTRLAWVFTSVEAIAFGAAGALFGSSIQRERAEKAETAAAENAGAAHRGEALAAAIKADARTPEEAGYASRGLTDQGGASSVAARHAALAAELFPD